jgi:deoxyribonuclease-4
MLVGEGAIGAEPFGWLLADRRSQGVPLILETPQQNPEIADDDSTADPWDVRMIELLRTMIA